MQGDRVRTDDIRAAIHHVAHPEGAAALRLALGRLLGVHHLWRGDDCLRFHRRPAIDHRQGEAACMQPKTGRHRRFRTCAVKQGAAHAASTCIIVSANNMSE